jgi:hypothetical protein
MRAALWPLAGLEPDQIEIALSDGPYAPPGQARDNAELS